MVPEPQAEGKIVGYISESMSEDEAERGSFRVFKVQSSIVLGLPSGDCTFLGGNNGGVGYGLYWQLALAWYIPCRYWVVVSKVGSGRTLSRPLA